MGFSNTLIAKILNRVNKYRFLWLVIFPVKLLVRYILLSPKNKFNQAFSVTICAKITTILTVYLNWPEL